MSPVDRARFVGPPLPQATRASAQRGPSTWTVKAGQTLSAISLRLYGDASLWRAIQLANAGVIPEKLQIGRELRIPSKEDARALLTPKPPASTFEDAKRLALDRLHRANLAAHALAVTTPLLQAADGNADGWLTHGEIEQRMVALEQQVTANNERLLATGGPPTPADVAMTRQAEADRTSLHELGVSLLAQGEQADLRDTIAQRIDASPDNTSPDRKDAAVSVGEINDFIKRHEAAKAQDPSTAQTEDTILGVAKDLLKVVRQQGQ